MYLCVYECMYVFEKQSDRHKEIPPSTCSLPKFLNNWYWVRLTPGGRKSTGVSDTDGRNLALGLVQLSLNVLWRW